MTVITGTSGNDTLTGTAGDDTIVGGLGNDTLIGDPPRPLAVTGISRVSTDSTGAQGNGNSATDSDPVFSPDGTKLLFGSTANNLVSGDTNGVEDLFLKDLVTGATTRISTGSSGNEGNGASYVYSQAFSPDGTKIVFESTSSNLVPGDTNAHSDVFLKDLTNGNLTRLSTSASGAQGNDDSFAPAFSPDGTKVAFDSHATNFVVGDTAYDDVFLKDLVTGAITRVSPDISAPGTGSYESSYPAFSPDGTKIAYETYHVLDLGYYGVIVNSEIDVKDLTTGVITVVANTDLNDDQFNYDQHNPTFSPDGKKIMFSSVADNLVAGDSNGSSDIFIKDLVTGTITRVSTDSSGAQANGNSWDAKFSPDGTKIVFYSDASNLVPGDTNGAQDVFLKDLTTGAVTRVSATGTGGQSNGSSNNPTFSPDGTEIAFSSLASNLVSGDTNTKWDVFVATLGMSLGGNDFLDGGPGIDTAVFAGPRSAYTITRSGAMINVSGPDGNDTLSGVEKAKFDDQTVLLGQGPTHSDFNTDIDSDILMQSDYGRAGIYLMNGAAVSSGGPIASNPGTVWHAKVAGDFNGDGKADILWQNVDGSVAIWTMNGTSLVGASMVGNPGPVWQIVGSGDFNGDGKSDILFRNTDGTPAIWLMNGSSISSVAAFPNPGTAWRIIGSGDFNGDGKSDILFQYTDGTPGIWLMNGTSFVSSATLPNPGPSWQIKAAGDFNGDGMSDLLWQNTDGTPGIWFLNGTSLVSSGIPGGNPGTAWHAIGAGDFNGDGKADILWQNADGTPAVWLMNGATVLSSAALSNPGSQWHVLAMGS
jgi:Tol biopolymer transport system component